MIINQKRELMYGLLFMSLLLTVGLYLRGYGMAINNSNQFEFKKYDVKIIDNQNLISKWIVKPIYLDGTN